MKIVLATPWWPPDGGGLENYARGVAHGLVARGHDVRVVAATTGIPEAIDDEGVLVERLPAASVVSNTPVAPRAALRLASLVKAWRPDVVNGHGPVPGALEGAAFASRLSGIPYVATYHAGLLAGGSPGLEGFARLLGATVEPWAFLAADRIVAVSPFVAMNRLARYAGKVEVVPPGVDLERFGPAEKPAEPTRLLFLGRLDPAYAWKGFHVLFEAFRRAHAADPRLTLTVGGGGRMVPGWRAKAETLGLPIDFVGRVPDEGLGDLYRSHGALALPSLTDAESFGMVAAEAAACGLPVVASDVGGVAWLVEHEVTGLLVPPGDPEALARGLREIASDAARSRDLGRAGHARVASRHAWRDVAESTDLVFEAAIAASSNGRRGRRAPTPANRSAPLWRRGPRG